MYRCLAFLTLICSFNVRNAGGLEYTYFGEYKAAYSPYNILIVKSKACQKSCDQDASCNGYSVDTSNDGCFLSSCDTYIDVPACSTCLYASKNIPLSVVFCPPFSTMAQSTFTTQSTIISQLTTTAGSTYTTLQGATTVKASSSITSASNDDDDTTIDNTSCVCVCQYVNQTLDESLERRRKDLVLNRNELSSSVRRLSSAPDYRGSVKVIGNVATVVLVLFGFFFLCTDLWSMLSFVLFKMCRNWTSKKPC